MIKAGVGVGIVGAGSLGLIFASRFGAVASADRPVVLVTRRQAVRDLINANGIQIRAIFDSSHIPSATTLKSYVIAVPPGNLGAGLQQDVVIVLGRSSESAFNLRIAAKMATAGGIVVMLQNGLRGWKSAADLSTSHVSGATHVGGWATGPNSAVWTRLGGTELPVAAATMAEAALARVQAAFAAAGMPLALGRSEADIVWRKTLITTINWLAAALGLPVDVVVGCTATSEAIRELLNEMLPVAKRDGVRVSLDDLTRDLDLIRADPATKGSAYASLEKGRQLEILDICESVIERAVATRIDVPHTKLLLNLARIQEEGFQKLPRMPHADRW